jgi:glucose/arabinose dehydrogenase
MIRSLTAISLLSFTAALACGNSDSEKNGAEATTTVPAGPGTDTASTSSTAPMGSNTGTAPTGNATTGSTATTNPTTPATTGPITPPPTTSGSNTTGPTPTGPGPTSTDPGPATTDTAPPANTGGEAGSGNLGEGGGGNTEPVDTGTTPSTEPSTDTPDGPPAGAYQACSGAAAPGLKLTPVIEDLDSPIYVTFPAGDANTMFVVLRGGELRRYDMTQTPPTFKTLLEVNASMDNECGFLSVALHPNFDGTAEKRIYVSYTPTCPAGIFDAGGSSTLDEYTVDGDTATFSKTLLELDQPQGNHNGGLAKFGPDGYLYFGLGDGGGGNDNSTGHSANGNGQDVTVPLGKLLRFDVDAIETAPPGNLTSADVGGADVDSRILHYGLRNPWRWSFDQLNGDLYIGDVGQDTWEEVDYLKAGAGPTNFGWSAREGKVACSVCNHTVFPSGTTPHEPIHVYPTNAGGSDFFKGSVIGGYVYRGSSIPGLYGRYIFAEFVRSTFFALSVDENGEECDAIEDLIPGAQIPGQSISSFGQDPNGEIYVMNLTRGEILKLEAE